MVNPTDVLPINLYDRQGRLLLAKGTCLTDKICEAAQKRGYDIHSLLEEQLRQDDIRTELDCVFVDFHDKYLGIDVAMLDQACEKVSREIIGLRHNELLHTYMMALVQHVGPIYVHSVNTAILTALLSKNSPYGDVRQMISAAFFHDLGMILVPPVLLTKAPDDFSSDEVYVWQLHTTNGSRLLSRPGVPELLSLTALTHHERGQGTGHPQGLTTFDIDKRVQLISLADTFDILTSNTPGQDALSIADALEMIQGEMRNDFQPDAVKALVELFETEDMQ